MNARPEAPTELSDTSIPIGLTPDGHCVAILSGKGGSGKTMLIACLARILCEAKHKVFIVDADTGTGGMTFYLGLKTVDQTALGLSTLLRLGSPEINAEGVRRYLQPLKGLQDAFFFGIGEYKKFGATDPKEIGMALGSVIETLKEEAGWIFVDCRGGIDEQSLAICKAADDLLLVVEPDATSFQATRRVVEVLADENLESKLRGFVVNKAFVDPSTVGRQGTGDFKCQYLGAVPFDFKTMRSFLIGAIPAPKSTFGAHVWTAFFKAFPECPRPQNVRTLSNNEFGEIGISNLDSIRGGYMAAGIIFLILAALGLQFWVRGGVPSDVLIPTLAVASIFGLAGSIETYRRLLGRAIDIYVSILRRLVTRRDED